jgi:hypothetical protein
MRSGRAPVSSCRITGDADAITLELIRDGDAPGVTRNPDRHDQELRLAFPIMSPVVSRLGLSSAFDAKGWADWRQAETVHE